MIRKKLLGFMNENIYPNEQRFVDASGSLSMTCRKAIGGVPKLSLVLTRPRIHRRR